MKCSKNTFTGSHSYDSGGGFYLNSFNISCDSNDPCISGCSFTKCNCGNVGGGICIVSPPTEFKMQNTIFISCKASNQRGGGGGMYFEIINEINVSKKQFYSCFFCNGSARFGKEVDIIDDKNYLKETPFDCYCFSSTDEGRLFYRNSTYNSNLDKWLLTGTLNRYISLKGENPAERHICECMNPNNPCATVEYAMELKIEEVHSAIVMKDDFVNEVNQTITIDGKDKLTLKGIDEKQRNPILSISKPLAEVSGLFNCSSFNLNVKGLIDYCFKTIIKSSETKLILNNFYIKCIIKKLIIFMNNKYHILF